ncbi:cyclic nucleotide gated channel 1, partial [Prunus dulcis]
MGDHPGKLLRELPETKPCGLSHSAVWCECADEDVGSLRGVDCEIPHRPNREGREAFWELTGFGFVGTPKLSELEAGAIPGWVTTLGSCFVSSQKQNRAG